MDGLILGQAVGERVEEVFAPGVLTDYQEGERFAAPRASFRTRKMLRRDLEPRLGRFYPRGFMAGERGLFSEDRRPLRITGLREGSINADSRHPLAALPLRLGVLRLAG